MTVSFNILTKLSNQNLNLKFLVYLAQCSKH